MSMRVYDRISVVRYNKDYNLPALESAGKTYVQFLRLDLICITKE
jgi:hypothetical protein